ncbi:MarR family winged helix-turn-helix transcriptional regulator [Streptomyces sp. NPDC017520]|uniref:MarR family winged helix-turn-helix transcriptional regulator n=1 Tax=Streptomyces sp. NPDC017520 TaxID=3364998 RepID=UPI0037890707
MTLAFSEYGPGTQAELSKRSGTRRSDMVGVLDELGERGIVERAPDPADRRRNVITISTRGRRRLSLLGETLDVLEGELLALLSPSERDQLVPGCPSERDQLVPRSTGRPLGRRGSSPGTPR